MLANVGVERYLRRDLLGFDASELVGMFFVDEFDGNDGFGSSSWAGFADAVKYRISL